VEVTAPPAASAPAPAVPLRPLLQDVYLQAEADRRLRILRFLEDRGLRPGTALRRLFARAGRVYGLATAWLGTRVMMRIAASSSRRASHGACSNLGRVAGSDLLYFATLRARNVGDLLQDLEQHLIDTAPRRDTRTGRRPGPV